jgi:competence protein ComEC
MRPARPGPVFILAFEAGLATGLSHFWATGCVTALLGALVGRRPLLGFAAAAALLGIGAGRLGQAVNQASCAHRLPAGALTLTVRLHDPGAASGLVSVAPVDAGCRGLVSMRVIRADSLPAGRVLRVTGRWLPRPGVLGQAGGLLLVSRLVSLDDRPDAGERLRTVVARASRSLYGSRAPLVEALVLGTRGGIDKSLTAAFASSGLVHLLSISGFHVGLIVAWIVLAAGVTGLPRVRALWCGALAGLLYAGFLGWPAPATRAAVLCVLGALQLQRQRHSGLGPLLGLTVLVVTIGDPWALTSVGAWLSVSALHGAAWAAGWSDRAVSRATVVRLISSSSGATLATAPITAMAFGTIPVIGVGLNLIAIPLAALAVPGVIASLLLQPLLPGLAEAIAAGSGLGLHGLELLARAGAAIPGGCLVVPPTPSSAAAALAVLLATRWIAGRYVTAPVAARRLGIALAAASWASAVVIVPWRSADASTSLTLHFLDVGQGDGAVIRTPGGHWVLVDAGPRGEGTDAGRRVVAPFLARARVSRLDVMVISHAHADHVGGAPAVLDRVDAGLVLEPGELVADPVYGDFLAAVEQDGARWAPARAGMRFTLDSVEFRVLHPDTAWTDWGLDLNEDSAVLLVTYRGFRALLVGDAGFPVEARLAGTVGKVDLLKVGHHGSRWASSDAWLEELQPSAGIVSVGTNRYGHPSAEALARLQQHQVAVWRTDRDGSVTVTTDGHQFEVAGRDRRARYPLHAEESEP